MRIVVIGNGMVGSRFVEDLCQRTEPHCAALSITVLGQESCNSYNRVLLTEVLAGAYELSMIGSPPPTDSRVHLLRGTSARSINTAEHTVLDSDGNLHHYDALVLATGADARLPELPSLIAHLHQEQDQPEYAYALTSKTAAHTEPAPTGHEPREATNSSAIDTSHAHDNLTGASRLPVGTHVLRTIDDVRELRAATANTRRAIVLGAGVLGIETAVALAGRGVPDVTLVHPRGLMNAQLGSAAGHVAAHRLEELGVRVRTHLEVTDLLIRDGRTAGLVVGNGEELPAELVVITTGIAPRVELGAAAGLAADRGLVTDADSRCLDTRDVYAIGDCAQPPQGATGLVAQGWDQSRQLARFLATGESLTGTIPTNQGSDVVKVKGQGVDIVAMGGKDAGEGAGVRVVQVSDPVAGRHIEVVVRDERVIAATCIGAGSIASDLTAAYTRGTPTPQDPLSMLIKQVGPVAASGQADSPVRIPDRATICRCNGVTKGAIVAAWRGGDRTVEEVAGSTRATTGCGGCTDAVCGIVDWLNSSSQREETTV